MQMKSIDMQKRCRTFISTVTPELETKEKECDGVIIFSFQQRNFIIIILTCCHHRSADASLADMLRHLKEHLIILRKPVGGKQLF